MDENKPISVRLPFQSWVFINKVLQEISIKGSDARSLLAITDTLDKALDKAVSNANGK